ncbi:MAG: hypothetical protein PHP97_04870 [Candidatus Shapirobacteria bacterium]|nr:hypothetical protein [Candidatus Shapirobacteria bacterium]MDD3002376.1 hypothetical protein [Candidatus Shapirobacteria bacterium]MDD4383316.1 hypothetical protein [Candidatus Shapirobacteria bacterium]
MPEQKNNPPPQELAIPEPGSVEYDLSPVKLPVGEKVSEFPLVYKPVTEEKIEEFFTPEMISRLVYCSNINVDLLDDWGARGYEPGFIFVKKSNYKGIKSLNDEDMMEGHVFDTFTTESGIDIMKLKNDHFDFFPRNKFSFEKISATENPEMFAYLRKKLNNVDINNISDLSDEDLEFAYRESIVDQGWVEYLYNEKDRLLNDQRREMTIKQLKESPKATLKNLQIIEEMQNRGMKNFEINESFINRDIEMAKFTGNPQLAEQITNVLTKTKSLVSATDNNQKSIDSDSGK